MLKAWVGQQPHAGLSIASKLGLFPTCHERILSGFAKFARTYWARIPQYLPNAVSPERNRGKRLLSAKGGRVGQETPATRRQTPRNEHRETNIEENERRKPASQKGQADGGGRAKMGASHRRGGLRSVRVGLFAEGSLASEKVVVVLGKAMRLVADALQQSQGKGVAAKAERFVAASDINQLLLFSNR